jgi:hypothetical protein
MASSAIDEYLAAHGNGEVSKWLKAFIKSHSDTYWTLADVRQHTVQTSHQGASPV